jgi:hypothetical protein
MGIDRELLNSSLLTNSMGFGRFRCHDSMTFGGEFDLDDNLMSGKLDKIPFEILDFLQKLGSRLYE